MTRVAILQSNYIPWKGYFDIIAAVDVFVVYDIVQYTRRDWRNRNVVKKPGGGKKWLTVPVLQPSFHQRIDETEIADRRAPRRHWSTIRQYYAEADGFASRGDEVGALMDRDAPARLSELNVDLLTGFCELLGIDTPFVQSSELGVADDDPSTRLARMCERLDADAYLSGPAARDYLDQRVFDDREIEVEWMDYEGYPEYDQPHPPFDHHVSIVDLVLCTGEDARAHLLRTGSQ